MSQDLDLGQRSTADHPADADRYMAAARPNRAIEPVDSPVAAERRADKRWRSGSAGSKRAALGRRLRARSSRNGVASRSASASGGPRPEALVRSSPKAQDVRTVRIRRVVDAQVPPALAARRTGPRAVDVGSLSGPPVPAAPPEPTDDVPRWMRTAGGYAWRILAMVGVMALVVYSMAKVQLVFVAVFLALVLTSVLRPAVNRLSRVMPRPLATVLALLAGVLTAAALVAYVVNSVASQWTSLAGQFNDGTGQILTFLENRDGRIPFTVTPEMITVWIESGRQWVVDHSGDLASNAVASAGSVAKIFGALALAAFCSVFFLARGAEMWSWLVDQLPGRARAKVRDAGAAGWYTFSGYARGTVIIALADGVLACLVLAILDVPLAAPLGVLVFIGAFIPLIGAPLAMLVAMVVALAANGLLNAVLVGLAIALIGQFEGHILQPLVMGRQVSLHPVVVALAVTAGTLLAGIVGAVVAVPVVAVTWAVYAKLHNVSPPLSAPRASIKVSRRAA